MKLSREELAAVLAGLRLLQATEDEDLSPGITGIFTDMGRLPGLTGEEINELCERLNCGE